MLEKVAAAFEQKDYKTASKLIEQLLKQEPNNPWVQFYVGRLHEVKNEMEAAENVYRQLLRSTTHPKVVAQARQGLQRLAEIEREYRRRSLAAAKAQPNSGEQSVLVLEPIAAEAKQLAAQKFARIMQLDAYTARLHLPSRYWRLYRTGSKGELQFYSQQLQKADIPNFSAAITDIEKIDVFRADYIKSASTQVTVVCRNGLDQVGSFSFKWSEVSQRVEGLLPIFEEVVDTDYRHKLQRKTKTLDYAQVCDLHLPGRRSIVRLCDRNYQFLQGITFGSPSQNSQLPSQGTIRQSWNELITFLNQHLPQIPVYADFTSFAETALEHIQLLHDFKSHIDLFRREDTSWDKAFQLYSGLVFLRKKHQPDINISRN